MRNRIIPAAMLVAAMIAALDAWAQPVKADAPPAGSPRSVVITFFQSFSDGNAKALSDSVLADNDDERRVAGGMTEVVNAVAGARKAIVVKFKVRDQDVNLHIIPVEMFSTMKEKVDGDTATLMQEGHAFILLKKVNGAWKIALGDLLKKGGKSTDQTMKDLRGLDRSGGTGLQGY